MLVTHYLKQFWKIVITFSTHIYQKTSINIIILGNAHITKPSYLKQLTQVTETISRTCCTRTVISLLLHPAEILSSPIVLKLFAILETFTFYLFHYCYVCTSFRLILYFISYLFCCGQGLAWTIQKVELLAVNQFPVSVITNAGVNSN